MKLPFYCLLFCSLLLGSCLDPWGVNNSTGYVDTYVPVYAEPGQLSEDIAFIEPIPTVNGGKIFTIGSRLFQVEEGIGVHVIDYSDKQHPRKLSFLNIPGCREVALHGSNMYVNNYADIVVLEMDKYPNLVVKTRKQNVFPELTGDRPPEHGYYICPDPAKGHVVKWNVKKIKNPQCYN